MPEVRSALEKAIDAGIVVRLLEETPQGSHEYFLLQSSWLLDAIRKPSNQAPTDTAPAFTGADAIDELAKFSFDDCAKQHGFAEGSQLTAPQLIEFFREGPYTATDIYKSRALYPTSVERFYLAVRNFIDDVLKKAVQTGVVVTTANEHGQELFGLAPSMVKTERPRVTQSRFQIRMSSSRRSHAPYT
jgi:hypothetical protein